MSALRISKEQLARAEATGRAVRQAPKDPGADRLQAIEIQQRIMAETLAEIRSDLVNRTAVRFEVIRGPDGLITAVDAVRRGEESE